MKNKVITISSIVITIIGIIVGLVSLPKTEKIAFDKDSEIKSTSV